MPDKVFQCSDDNTGSPTDPEQPSTSVPRRDCVFKRSLETIQRDIKIVVSADELCDTIKSALHPLLPTMKTMDPYLPSTGVLVTAALTRGTKGKEQIAIKASRNEGGGKRFRAH